jgi:Ser/Thr protein kinase RdoA (MazF antagonist)
MPPELNQDVFSNLSSEKILSAVESTGLRCTGRIVPLNSMENRVFSVDIEANTISSQPIVKSVVAKFYRPGRWNRSQLLGEHALAQVLSFDGIQTPAYLPILDPTFGVEPKSDFLSVLRNPKDLAQLKSHATLGQIPGYFFCVWQKISGRAPLEVLPDDLRRIGRLIARMHNLFESRFDVPSLNRPKLETNVYLLAALSHLEDSGLVPKNFQDVLFRLGEDFLSGLSWFDHCLPFLPIHGDLHRLNLVKTEQAGDYWIVDFDDCVLGPEIQDLWLFASTCDISGHIPEHETRTALDFLLEGYSHMRKLPEGSLQLVEPLRTMRMIHYMGWIAKRWAQDEMFRSTFSFFTTQTYWERTIQDLEEQKALLEDQGLLEL